MYCGIGCQVSMEQHVETCSQAAALTTAIVQGDIALLGSALCK